MRKHIFLTLAACSLLHVSAAGAADDVDAHNAMTEAKSKRGWARSALDRGEWDKATEYANKCLEALVVLDKNPKLKRETEFMGDKLTYADLKATCTQLVKTDIPKAKQEANAAATAEGQKVLTGIADYNYAYSVGAIAEAKKLAKAGKFIDALDSYVSAVDKLGTIVDDFERQLEKTPNLATFEVPAGKGKKLTAKQMIDEARKLRAEAKKAREEIQSKAEKLADQMEEMLQKRLKGDRKRVYAERGSPSWYDGADYLDTEKRYKSVLTSSYWRFDTSDGCSVTVRFSGNKQTSKSSKPAGCEN